MWAVSSSNLFKRSAAHSVNILSWQPWNTWRKRFPPSLSPTTRCRANRSFFFSSLKRAVMLEDQFFRCGFYCLFFFCSTKSQRVRVILRIFDQTSIVVFTAPFGLCFFGLLPFGRNSCRLPSSKDGEPHMHLSTMKQVDSSGIFLASVMAFLLPSSLPLLLFRWGSGAAPRSCAKPLSFLLVFSCLFLFLVACVEPWNAGADLTVVTVVVVCSLFLFFSF